MSRKNAVKNPPKEFHIQNEKFKFKLQIREILSEHDISVSYLAEVASISLPVLYNLINGIRDTRLEIYLKLYVALNMILAEEGVAPVTFEAFCGLNNSRQP